VLLDFAFPGLVHAEGVKPVLVRAADGDSTAFETLSALSMGVALQHHNWPLRGLCYLVYVHFLLNQRRRQCLFILHQTVLGK